jgi:hypothetical protein
MPHSFSGFAAETDMLVQALSISPVVPNRIAGLFIDLGTASSHRLAETYGASLWRSLRLGSGDIGPKASTQVPANEKENDSLWTVGGCGFPFLFWIRSHSDSRAGQCSTIFSGGVFCFPVFSFRFTFTIYSSL